MNGKTIISIVVGALAFFAVKYGVSHFFSNDVDLSQIVKDHPEFSKTADDLEDAVKGLSPNSSIEEILKVTEESMTKNLPIKVDDNTILVGVKAGPGKLFTYDYHIVDLPDITAEQLETAMKPSLTAQYNGPDMKAYKDNKVIAIYRYSQKNGDLISEITIGPEE